MNPREESILTHLQVTINYSRSQDKWNPDYALELEDYNSQEHTRYVSIEQPHS